MCGIVGYIGNKNPVNPVIDGLHALEYRGYDSAGVAALIDDKLIYSKQTGAVANLVNSLELNESSVGGVSIGHTRWATHGEPSINNAHPHTNNDQSIFIVHNGIVENYKEIKAKLQKLGYEFISKTDTEVIPHLIDWHYRKHKNFKKAFTAAISELRGAYAIAAVHRSEPDELLAARLSSPLIIGVGKNSNYIASDATAILSKTKKVIYLDDYDIACITTDSVDVMNIKKNKKVLHSEHLLDTNDQQAKLGDFKHFMIKEIFDTPQTVLASSRGRALPKTNTIRLGGLQAVEQQLRFVDRIVIIACGTSYYAGLVGEYLIEDIAGIPVEVQLASEFKYRTEPFSRSTAVIAISQSGETADTIAALKKVDEYGVLKLGIVNVVGSTIARMTDAGVYCHAGPELSVASTKAFVSQVTVLVELALFLSRDKTQKNQAILEDIAKLPAKIESILKQSDKIKKISKKYSDYRDFLYIGRRYSYPVALEGALKLKEVSYIHAEGYAAGEMKHGPLAMIDENFPTLAIATKTDIVEKTHSNIEEIKARKGPVLAIATEGDKNIKSIVNDAIYIPDTSEQTQPILIAIVMQLFAYHVATEKGLNVDRPRNLAKSVTVE